MDGSQKNYYAWIEIAEERLARWLEPEETDEGEEGDEPDGAEETDRATKRAANAEPLQLRDIAAIVGLIKALVDVRRKLETWQNDGEELKTSAAGGTTDEEIFELMERCESPTEDPLDEGEMPL